MAANCYRPAVSSSGHTGGSPDQSPSWIVELRTVPKDDWARTPVIFHADVLTQQHPPGPAWATVTIRHERPDEPLVLTSDRVDLRVQTSDLPATLTAAPTQDLDHVIHMWCAGGLAPEAIEEFLEATRGIAADYALGREAWLEVLSHATDPDGGESGQPMFDEIFLGRYATPEHLERLQRDPRWVGPSERLHASLTSRLDLILQPRFNRLATQR